MKRSTSLPVFPGSKPTRLLGALLIGLAAASAQATGTWVTTHTRAHDVGSAVHLGLLPATQTVHVTIALKLRNQEDLDALTSKIMAGVRMQHLTHDQFMARHAPTEAQVQAVVDYLQQHGFTNISVADNRLLVNADGTAAAIKGAFKAELHQYNVHGRIAHANTTDAQVPQALADTVNAVLGLQTVHMAHIGARRLAAPQAITNSVVAVNPPLFPSIYGANSLPSATNATIGIITQGSMTQTLTDLKNFASSAGYPQPSVSVVTVGGSSSDTSGIEEWNMDSQSSLAAAGGTIKQMLLYTAPTLSDSALTNDYNKAVSDNLARVINVSLGECETSAKSSGVESTDDAIFQTAVAQGQTFSVSSGDSGSYECGGSTNEQSYPAVSPYVMSLGGTTLSSSGGSWVSETVWSCTSASNCSSAGGTGGGVSSTESAPSWQTASGVLAGSTKRGVPDVAFDASPSSGALVLVNGSNEQIGGTSLSAPLFTGFYSRIQSANGNTLPFPAATLYQGAASNPQWFHDVTSGSNGGYSAKSGWDYTTGFGSLQVANFAGAFSGGGGGGTGGTPSANFSFAASGLTVSFTDTSTDAGGSIGTHSWNFGDGATSSSANPSHTYAAAGTYSVSETVTDSVNGQSSSKTESVTVSGGGTGGGQLLQNSGFESGSTGWTASSGVVCTNSTCSGETAHSGTGFAWLDGYGRSHTDTVSQSVTIPSTVSSATLAFYLHIDTAETTTTRAYDKLTVQVTSGGSTTTLATYSNLNKNSGYALKSFDMSAYKGKTVTVKFTGTEDSSLQTSFVLDDITLSAQ